MWCEHCQTDVATEVAQDGQSLRCTTCGQPVRHIVAPSLHPETRSAREFLEKWAREQQTLKQQREAGTGAGASPVIPSASPRPEETGDKSGLPASLPGQPASPLNISNTPGVPPVSSTGKSAGEVTRSPEPPVVEKKARPEGVDLKDTAGGAEPRQPERPEKEQPKWRIDQQHGAPSGPVPARRERPRRMQRLEQISEETAAPAASSSGASEDSGRPLAETTPAPRPVKVRRQLDAAHSGVSGPHFDVTVNAPSKSSFPGRTEAMWGQLMAYLGVGLLTVGTVLVLWGYFGDIEQYASTGWLMSAAGQMLLLLGIVTLVGGGMQQTTHEVSQRIEHLGGRIIRIEQSTDQILNRSQLRRSRKRRQASGESAESSQDAA